MKNYILLVGCVASVVYLALLALKNCGYTVML